LTTVFISVDTEEDSWGDYQSRNLSTANAKRLPGFQRLCDRYGAVPTYLVDYPMTQVGPGPGVPPGGIRCVSALSLSESLSISRMIL